MSTPFSLANTFLGVDRDGNCLPGPYLPFGLVRLGPDCAGARSSTGYGSGLPIRCFSHTHVAGTGGGGRYGNIGLYPFIGVARACPDAAQPKDESGEPGYYAVTLGETGIRAELTCTHRVGVHRYTFPAGSESHVLVDLGAVVQADGGVPGEHTGKCTAGFMEALSEREIAGRADFQGGWGHKAPYTVFFHLEADRPFGQPLFCDGPGGFRRRMATGAGLKAVLSFGQAECVGIKVGISFMSAGKAKANLAREAGGMEFAAVRRAAREAWEKALGRIRVQGGLEGDRALFYSFFHRLLCMPTDLGLDENPWFESGGRTFTDFYCLWDSVRNANSLLGLIAPETEAAFLASLLATSDHQGWLVDAWIAGHPASSQGGSSADILFCEAHLKGLAGIDYPRALAAMRKNNEVESPDPWFFGRFLPEYRDRGYLSARVQGCASKHIEYSYQDWCVARLAERLGMPAIRDQYLESAKKFWNLWDPAVRSIAPRSPAGPFLAGFDPRRSPNHPAIWADPYFYEGTGFQWTLTALHALPSLVERHGGPEGFAAHLDEFFANGYYYWKEISLHTPYLYLYAGRPDKAAERVRDLLGRHYRNARDGLPDNEDMGCQSAFFMAAALGVYPVMGQDLYWLSPPLFGRSEIGLGEGGKVLVIEARSAGAEGKYIRSATLDGKPLERAWLFHGEIVGGATLELELGPEPGDWGRDRPPPVWNPI